MSGPRIKLCIAFFWIAPISFFAYLSFVHPWQAALDALATFERGPRIVTAVSYQGGLIDASAPIHRTQVYLVLPDSLRSLNAYQVIQDDRGVRVETVRFGLLVFMGLYGAWVCGSFWYVLGRANRRAHGPSET